MIALDGERELAFTPDQRLTVKVDAQGPFTIDIGRAMARGARDGLLAVHSLAGKGAGDKVWN